MMELHARYVHHKFYMESTLAQLQIYSAVYIYLFNFAYKGRVTTTAYANYCGPALPNPPCQLSCMWEETGVPGENPRPSAER